MYGVSKDKFCKSGEPKHAGNFSKFMMHYCSKSYAMVKRGNSLIIGNSTAAETKLPKTLIELILNDPKFKQITRESVYKHHNQEYKCEQTVRRSTLSGYGMSEFIYSEAIDTRGDFKYEFPNY